ncbi:hydrolase [Brevundimonas sp.]|uniref:hydrolase n=1 Tax=Brevundimonas sp. TaxID=1871086 RepID=UPI003D6CAD32
MTVTASPVPAKSLLTPADHTLILVDHQSQMAFATQSIDGVTLRSNTALISKAAKGFNVPTVLTTVAEKSFSGPLFKEIQDAFPGQAAIDRTTMNAWEDKNVTDAVNAAGHGRVVIAGLWTSVCVVGPALSALEQGFEVYVITDASGDVSTEAIQAGARPLTSVQYLLELQRDWARGETYDLTTGIAAANAGSYGIGLQYAKAMLGEHAREG